MYARNVALQLKPNTAAEFNKTIASDILPLLRKQNGFTDEMTLVDPNGRDVVAISLWDRKESADRYNSDTYPQVLKDLAKVVDGTPVVHSYEVASSTFHKIAN